MRRNEHRLQLPNSGCHWNLNSKHTTFQGIQIDFSPRHGWPKMWEFSGFREKTPRPKPLSTRESVVCFFFQGPYPFWWEFFSNKPRKLQFFEQLGSLEIWTGFLRANKTKPIQSWGCLTANGEMIYNPCIKHNAKVPKGSCCSFHNFHIYYIYTYTY